jgi:hypothetical protein
MPGLAPALADEHCDQGAGDPEDDRDAAQYGALGDASDHGLTFG